MAAFEPFKMIVELLRAQIMAAIDIVDISVGALLECFGLRDVLERLTVLAKQLVGTIMDIFVKIAAMLDSIYTKLVGVIPCQFSR